MTPRQVGRALLLLGFGPAAAAAQPATVPTWRVTQDLRISGSAESLDRVKTPIITRNRSLVVADIESGVLSFYDSTGRRAARVRAKGSGPGELALWGFGTGGSVGDSVWFTDQSYRLIVYSEGGKLVRTSTFQKVRLNGGALKGALYASTALRGVLSDGALLFNAKPIIMRGGRPGSSDTSLIVVGTAAGAELKRLGIVDESSWWVRSTGQGRVSVPFVVPPQFRPSSDGSFALFMSARHGRNRLDTLMVTVVRSNGDTAYAIKPVFATERIPDAEFAAAKKKAVALTSTSSAAAEIAAKMSRTYPVVDDAIVTREGRAWLRLRAVGGVAKYLVISPLGKPEGLISLPQAVWVIDAMGDRVWGTAEDSDGFINILRFKMSR